MWDVDCIPPSSLEWPLSSTPPQSPGRASGSGPNGEFVIGILASDSNTPPLPPILNLLSEVESALNRHTVLTTCLPTPPAFTKSQSLSVRLMSIDGSQRTNDLLEKTQEPLIPWLAHGPRFGRGRHRTLAELRDMAIRRTEIEREMQRLWYDDNSSNNSNNQKQRKLDAIITPVAPHPVPEIDRYNAVGYTSSFVLLDWPAGTVPVRMFEERDLQRGKEVEGNPISSWDARNRELCKFFDFISPAP